MNYEELLETRDVRKTTKVRLPYGYFYKRLIDGKYSNFVEFHDEVADAITFNNSVMAEHEALAEIRLKQQLHYTPNEGDDGIYAIAVEVGNYVTIEQLLNENPSMVAKGDFVISTLRDLFDVTVELHAHNIYHVCYAPSNILARKSDGSVRLLCHGSFYEKIGADILYEDLEGFVAPEVMAGGSADARSDVYSLGRFISWIYQSSGLPFELKHIVEKATAEAPDNRYQTADAMRKAINKARTIRKTGILGASAFAIALCLVGFLKSVNPEAVCGTNFASWREESRRVGDKLFSGGHPFSYVGDDQYFGSWQEGSVEDWPGVLDSMWDAYGLPILVNEWGYSSKGRTLSREELGFCPDNDLHLEPVCYHKAWCNEMPGGHNEDVLLECGVDLLGEEGRDESGLA